MVLLNYIRIYLVLIKVGPRLPKAFYIKIRITKVNSKNSNNKSMLHLVFPRKHRFSRNEQTRYNSYN